MSRLKPEPAAGTPQDRAAFESRQSRKKALALALLLAAFVALIVKDRQFWFGSDESDDADLAQPEVAAQTPAKAAPAAVEARPIAVSPARKQGASARVSQAERVESAVAATERTALPPLEVEVIAGDSRRTLRPGSNATKVEITNAGSPSSSGKPEFAARLTLPANASELDRLSTATRKPALGSFDGSYPLLAQQMKVQGSVVLQALISADGFIQHLHVLSGPSILATAAQQAVREWRFKPCLENGQAVETRATITVNFTINVADGSITTASLNPAPGLIIQTVE
jgi:TonB family protein